MLTSIKNRHRHDLELIEAVYEYHKNPGNFARTVRAFDRNALRAYVILLTHFSEELLDLPADLCVFTGQSFFSCLMDAKQALEADKVLSTYAVDILEILVQVRQMPDDAGFYGACSGYLDAAIESNDLHIVSILFQIFHRLDQATAVGLPIELLMKVVEVAHSTQRSSERTEAFFTEALLLLDGSLRKQHNQKVGKTGRVLAHIWDDLCPSNIMKHQCDNCYSIISHLIDVYLAECKANDQFGRAFLTHELWSFIRVAIESKTMKSRKQAIFMLQNVLQANSLATVRAVTRLPRYVDDAHSAEVNYADIWSQYFVILETLLDVQFKLIVQCLDEYLESIVEHIPQFWSGILFTQILQHHNNFIIYQGVEFIVRHSISLQHDANLMMVFFNALNNTYLYTEVEFSTAGMVKYLTGMEINGVLDILAKINWTQVPVWMMADIVATLLEQTDADGVHMPTLFRYVKRSLPTIKSMPQASTFFTRMLAAIKGQSDRLTLDNIMYMYEAIPCADIVLHADEVLDHRTFEDNFIQLTDVSVRTKIVFFRHLIADVKEQLHFLDGFYEKNKGKIRYYPDYEYLLFDSICASKPFYSAMLILKPRLYNLLKVNNTATIESLHLAVSLLAFVVDKYLNGENRNLSTYDSIKKIAYNFYETFREKAFVGNDPKKFDAVYAHLVTIDSLLSSCKALYPNSMEVLGILHDAALIDHHPLNLVRLEFGILNALWVVDNAKNVSFLANRFSCLFKF